MSYPAQSTAVLILPHADFVRIPKNASSATVQALWDRYGKLNMGQTLNFQYQRGAPLPLYMTPGDKQLPIVVATVPAMPDKPCYAHWRDPYRRIESAYKWFNWTGRRAPVRVVNGSELPKGSLANFEDFVHLVCSTEDVDRDMHTRSQYRNCCRDLDAEDCRDFMPTEVIRWDFKALERALDIKMPATKVNASVGPNDRPCPWTPELRLAFEAAFRTDLEVWAGKMPTTGVA